MGTFATFKRPVVIVGVAAGVVFLVLLLTTGYYRSVFSSASIAATKNNPFGIEGRVAYVRVNTAIPRPMKPCDTSGFVLKVMGKENAILLEYDICRVGALSCAHYEGFAGLLRATPKLSNQAEKWGGQSLDWRSD